MSNNSLRYVIFVGLFAVPFVPLIVASSLFFPFITGKAFVFRILVEVVFACYLVLAVRESEYRPKFSWILGSIIALLLTMALANFFSPNPLKAFWSNFERMEGYITILHLAAFFVVMSSMLKTEQVWNKLLTTSVFASLIMSVYSLFQLSGRIAINQGGVRVDGTLGNASYLGIYMVFHIFFAALLVVRSREKWKKIVFAIIGALNLFILYHTATRGSILGLLGGVGVSLLFLTFKSEKGSKLRKTILWGVIALVVFVGLFISVRNTSYVKNSPVLSRFASLSFSEIKTQGRYYVWPMAVKGFVENPVLGWGQEGFNFVFNKYYDPRMYNQEPWFDRAHNTYLDWLVAGGLLGFLSYISIVGSLLYYTFKASDEFLKREEKAVILGVLSAYFFNNLFVFDQISSYILFFTVLAYVHAHTKEAQSSIWERVAEKLKNLFEKEHHRPIIESVVVIILILVLYFANFVPWRQNKNLLAVLRLNNEGKVGTMEDYQNLLSGSGMWFPESLEHISQTAISIASNQNTPPEFRQSLFDTVDKSFIKQLERVPDDARYRLFYGLYLSRFGWYGRAVEQLKIARDLSPKKQQMYFELANNLILDGKQAEALEAAKTAYELEPSYQDAKFFYAIMASTVGDSATANEIFSGEGSKIIFDDRYISALLSMREYDRIIEVIKQRIALEPANLQHLITLTAAYLEAGRRSDAISTIEQLIKLEPSFKEKGDYYISEIKAGRNP